MSRLVEGANPEIKNVTFILHRFKVHKVRSNSEPEPKTDAKGVTVRLWNARWDAKISNASSGWYKWKITQFNGNEIDGSELKFTYGEEKFQLKKDLEEDQAETLKLPRCKKKDGKKGDKNIQCSFKLQYLGDSNKNPVNVKMQYQNEVKTPSGRGTNTTNEEFDTFQYHSKSDSSSRSLVSSNTKKNERSRSCT